MKREIKELKEKTNATSYSKNLERIFHRKLNLKTNILYFLVNKKNIIFFRLSCLGIYRMCEHYCYSLASISCNKQVLLF
jgi:hypothetical protein